MGTRGAYGFRIDGQDKITYNHFDSYPGVLGRDIVNHINTALDDWGKEVILERARSIELVEKDSTPSEDQIENLSKYADTRVSTGQLDEWYVLLRDMQGKLYDHLQAGLMIDGHDFMASSLFCEWAYIVNLDENTLEVYRGFQKEPHDLGRYSDMETDPGSDYEPVALVADFPLWELDEDMMDEGNLGE